jgi:septal ring factor EnvC (AmiA/AmiB activator)
MARQGISTEQVYEAAGTLLEEGTPPTVQAVRERLGSGSYTTISRYLDAWRKEHAGQAPANIPAMPEKVMGAFQQVWATAARVAQEDTETQRQALEAMRREMEKDRADMAAEIARLEKALEGAEHKASGLEKALETERKGRGEAQEQVTALRIDHARLEERAKAAEGRAGELKAQVEGLQMKFAEIARQQERTGRSAEAPRPQDP